MMPQGWSHSNCEGVEKEIRVLMEHCMYVAALTS